MRRGWPDNPGTPRALVLLSPARHFVFKVSLISSLAVGALWLAPASQALLAQSLPSPAEAQRILQARPELAATIRARISSSGLTPEQIRARLRASGYSESLLDAYMGGNVAGNDSTAVAPESVLNAVRFLGLIDSVDVAAAASGRRAAEPIPAPERTTATASRSNIFGLDVFRRSTSQFEADLAGPVDANYRVGPRDVLALILTGGVENSYSLEVTREGFVVIPNVGQVHVANLTLDQVNQILFERLRRVYSGLGRGPEASTKFYVTVAKLRTNQVFVVGEASAPGSYMVSSAGTMLTALYGAGGPADNGSLRSIQLRRAGRTVADLDVYSYLLNGDASGDARLETGDVVFVPIHGPRVQINGQVIRPATYELKGSETLRDLIRMAGGFRAEAGRRRVLVRRVVPPNERAETGGRDRTVLDVASSEFATGFGPAFPLVDGDIVEVAGVPERVRNEIAISGAVWTPGSQGFRAGMRLSDAIRNAGGVRPDVKDALISRLQSDQSRQQLRAEFSDTLGNLRSDILLQEDDSIVVYGTSDFRPDRYVRIAGAVNRGGRYPWSEGMTLKDLIHLAGGLDDGAFLVHAEVARLPENRTPGRLARTLLVPMDSTYLLERGLDGKYVGPTAGRPARPGQAPEFELEPYDNVLILLEPDWQLERRVSIIGEVQFPGEYTLRTKQDKLTELLTRAGGLTPRAYPEGAVFSRPNSQLGRVGLDLRAAIRDSRHRDNFVLFAGDTLYIPPYRPTVKIEGAVHSPIAVAYIPGKKLDYYIDAAGGTTFNADKDRAFVRQPNGIVEPYKSRFLLPNDNPTPAPGAIVFVPSKDPNAKKDWTAIAGSIAQIVVGLVGIIAIARR